MHAADSLHILSEFAVQLNCGSYDVGFHDPCLRVFRAHNEQILMQIAVYNTPARSQNPAKHLLGPQKTLAMLCNHAGAEF